MKMLRVSGFRSNHEFGLDMKNRWLVKLSRLFHCISNATLPRRMIAIQSVRSYTRQPLSRIMWLALPGPDSHIVWQILTLDHFVRIHCSNCLPLSDMSSGIEILQSNGIRRIKWPSWDCVILGRNPLHNWLSDMRICLEQRKMNYPIKSGTEWIWLFRWVRRGMFLY